MMKSFLTFLIMVSGLLFGGLVAAKPLELVTLNYAPYEYLEDNQHKGIAVEILTAAFKAIEQPITIRQLPWARAISMVEHGDADAIFTAYKNSEREKFADYCNEVLIQQVTALFVQKNSTIEYFGDLKILHDYKFGLVRKFSYGKLFDDAVKGHYINNIQYVNSSEENARRLSLSLIHIMPADRMSALYHFKKIGYTDHKELQPILQEVPSYITFSKKRNRVDVRDRLDVQLRKMKQSGQYNKIIDRFYESL